MLQFVIFKMVQLSLINGMSPMSLVGFCFYGSLQARDNCIQDGYHFVKISNKLLNKHGTKEVSGIIIIIFTHVLFLIEPMQSANEYFLRGHDTAMSAGDTEYAMVTFVCYAQVTF